MDTGFYDSAFNTYGGDSVPLGIATNAGKLLLWATGDNLDLLDSFLLFGDPATGLHVIPNVPPQITGQVPLSLNEDTFLVLGFGNLTVTDPDDPYPTNFTLTLSPGENYTFEHNIITPDPNFFGSLTVPVTVNDGHDDSNTYNLTVTVSPINDPPVAIDETYETPRNTALVKTAAELMANDIDVDNTNCTAQCNIREFTDKRYGITSE